MRCVMGCHRQTYTWGTRLQGVTRDHGRIRVRKMALIAAIAAILGTSLSAQAEDKSSGRKAQEQKQAEIPICTKKLGTIAVMEPDNNWWQALGLGSPEAVIKMFVMKSGCFGLVDRNKGLAARSIERALADDGGPLSVSTGARLIAMIDGACL